MSNDPPSRRLPGLPRRILLAVDGSEPAMQDASLKAAEHALSLAGAAAGELKCVSVIQIPEYLEESTRGSLREELRSRCDGLLEEIRKRASDVGVRFDSRILETSGAVSSAICRFSESDQVDLIVLGTRANTPALTKMMLGSVAAGVAGNAKCPVLVVR
jgi:nucleotide-binding universal stress UspA family protein